MGKKRSTRDLGGRERQIMDVIFQLQEASVGDVLERLPDPPSYSAVLAIFCPRPAGSDLLDRIGAGQMKPAGLAA